jgi:hypothetical protein
VSFDSVKHRAVARLANLVRVPRFVSPNLARPATIVSPIMILLSCPNKQACGPRRPY